MFQSKRIFWQYEVEGEWDMEKQVEKIIRETADEYTRQAETTKKAMKSVLIKPSKDYHRFKLLCT